MTKGWNRLLESRASFIRPLLPSYFDLCKRKRDQSSSPVAWWPLKFLELGMLPLEEETQLGLQCALRSTRSSSQGECLKRQIPNTTFQRAIWTKSILDTRIQSSSFAFATTHKGLAIVLPSPPSLDSPSLSLSWVYLQKGHCMLAVNAILIRIKLTGTQAHSTQNNT